MAATTRDWREHDGIGDAAARAIARDWTAEAKLKIRAKWNVNEIWGWWAGNVDALSFNLTLAPAGRLLDNLRQRAAMRRPVSIASEKCPTK